MLLAKQTLTKPTPTLVVLNNNMSVKTFDVDYINSFRHRINRELPFSVMKALNISTKIKSVMNEKDLKIFNRNMDNFDAPTLKKKINSLLNKLSPANIESIFQKVSEILKSRKILIEYTIKALIVNTLKMPILIDTYAQFFKKLHTPKTEEIFQETLKESLSLLNGKVDSSKINSAEDYGKFVEYLEDKSKFTSIYLLLVSLNELKIVKDEQILEQFKELEEIIINSTPEQNDKYAETYIKIIRKISNKKYINLEKIKEIIKAKVVSTRIKFALYDIQDLHKCNFCKKSSCRTCDRLKKCSKQ